MPDRPPVIARSKATKQSSWIATPGVARLAMTWMSLPARAAGAIVWIYQQALSPALAAFNPTCGCRFAPTCSQYAREALHTHGFVIGAILTLRRLVKCGPWHPGGEDPVPWADNRTTRPRDNQAASPRPPVCYSVRSP